MKQGKCFNYRKKRLLCLIYKKTNVSVITDASNIENIKNAND